jgi:hypothetical protein
MMVMWHNDELVTAAKAIGSRGVKTGRQAGIVNPGMAEMNAVAARAMANVLFPDERGMVGHNVKDST